MEETTVNAVQESGEGSQIDTQSTDTQVNDGASVSENQQSNVEPTETESSKPQSKEENAAWKQMRQEKEQAAQEAAQIKRDLNFARQYGKEWDVFTEEDVATKYGSQDITTWEQFTEAVEEHKRSSDPDEYYKELGKKAEQEKQQSKQKQNNETLKQKAFQEIKEKHISDFVNHKEYSQIVNKWTSGEENMPQEVMDAMNNGSSLIHAYELSQTKAKLTKYEIEESNKRNAESAMGSVTGKGGAGDEGIISKETFKANRHDSKWVSANYEKLNKSMKTWTK